MAIIQVGCAGWDYKDWIGPFYPKNLEKYQHLDYYTKFFEIVEINSTFYNLPSEDTVIKWALKVPKTFKYIVKLWQDITHKINDPDIENRISRFFNRMKPLEEKIVAFLIQFPPWFKYSKEHLSKINYLIQEIPFNENFKYIFELRDDSWFNKNILSQFINGEHRILGTTYMPKVSPYYHLDQKFYYIRLIGDRELTVFNRVQRDQIFALDDLEAHIKKFQKDPGVHEIFIIVNNHFMGFAPESANLLKKRFGLLLKRLSDQKSMLDFI